jgi:NifU-like protein
MSSAFVTEHFFSPRNVGDIDNPDGTGRAGSITCGAALRISLSIDDSRRITEAKFRSAGCSYLVAACSSLTNSVKGKTTGEAAASYQSPEAFSGVLPGDWPADRYHCARLAWEALVSAIRNYSDAARDEWSGDDALICTCFGVSERTIEAAIQREGLSTIDGVTKASKAGAGCKSCYPLIEDILAQHIRERDANLTSSQSR